MKLRDSVLAKACVLSGAFALLAGISACAGGSGSSTAAPAPTTPLTQSNITLPSSVQVVTAN
jgi:hypothetical protein